jgi:hypothetical protein
MRRPISLAVLLVAMGLMAGCQPSLSGKTSEGVTPNAVTGDAIETTALDAVPGEEAEGAGGAAAAPDAAAGNETASPQSAPQPLPEATPVADTAEPAPTPDLTQTPVTPKSEQQLACEKKKGRWQKIGKGEARACVIQTRDSGKRCERESQCDSVCLARSGTCAPFKPMYGCNEILQDNGARVTLCLD